MLTSRVSVLIFPIGEMMTDRRDEIGADHARWLGSLIRARRKALGLRLDDLAAATGVGRRFLHELETGKPTCQLGRALAVAAAVGIRPRELFEEVRGDDDDLPPMSGR